MSDVSDPNEASEQGQAQPEFPAAQPEDGPVAEDSSTEAVSQSTPDGGGQTEERQPGGWRAAAAEHERAGQGPEPAQPAPQATAAPPDPASQAGYSGPGSQPAPYPGAAAPQAVQPGPGSQQAGYPPPGSQQAPYPGPAPQAGYPGSGSQPGQGGDPNYPAYPGPAPQAGGYGADPNQPGGWYQRPNPAWDPDPYTAAAWDQGRGHWGQQPPTPTQQWIWGAPPAPPASNRRDRRRRVKTTAAIAGMAILAGAAAGASIGHVTWSGTPSAAVSAPAPGTTSPGATSPSTGGGSTSGGSNSGNSGTQTPGSSGGFGGQPTTPGSGGSGSPSTTPGSGGSPTPGGSNGGGFGGGGFGGGGFGDPGFGGGGSGGNSSGSSQSGSVSTSTGSPSDVSQIVKKVTPGLVDVNVTLGYQDEEAAGTGMVLTSDGTVLTNNHVIDGATKISVTDLANMKTYNAKVVGYDTTKDVAVIQLIGASGLQTVSIGNSSTTSVGEGVVGIGNAGGAGGKPSAAGGAVTALNQSIKAEDDGGGNAEQLSGLIGTNAEIQAGDSGGPLVDASGQVLGIDTAGSSSNNSSFSANSAASDQSIGYAIPINEAISLEKAMVAGQGSSTIHIGDTGFLGVSVGSPGDNGGAVGGFGGFGGESGTGSSGSGNSGTTSGAEISTVVSGGAAEQAGLGQGDVITAMDGKTIANAGDVSAALVSLHPGDKVQVTYTNTSGTTATATVTLASGPPA